MRTRGDLLPTHEALQKRGGFFQADVRPAPRRIRRLRRNFRSPACIAAAALREAFHDDEAARMVLHTCDRMAAGGIHDPLGGGFARYSVDAEWLVPQLREMLYDQAQLAQLYLDAHLVSEERVIRDLTLPAEKLGLAELAPSEGKRITPAPSATFLITSCAT